MKSNPMRHLVLVTLVACSLGASVQEQLTIPERVSRGLGWIPPSPPSGIGPNMRKVLRHTDTIMTGIIGKPLPSYLSPDQREVFTDYPIVSPTFAYDEQPAETSPVPKSLAMNVTVAVRGGTVSINGAPYRVTYPGQPLMPPGSQCLFLLKRTSERGKYRLVSDYVGVYEVSGDRLNPLYPDGTFPLEYGKMNASTATERIVALAREVRAKEVRRK